jgi:eukaryotic-like serine/threonine-protein kinase
MQKVMPHEKRVGTVIEGKWRLDALLGVGSTAAVFAATHRNGHQAALKIMHRSLASDPSVAARFQREAYIANAVRHRAIVPVRDDATTEEGSPYLVLDRLEGETLEARRERSGGTLSLEELAPIAEELMSALAAVHAAGVVHRDLKPHNVFLTTAGEIKLLDFGTARAFDRAPGVPVSVQGLVIGTPSFMSPEQARGAHREIDGRSDVWSLGALLFTVLSGHYVHEGRTSHARLLAAAQHDPRSVASVMPSLEGAVAVVIDRALAFAKEDRWQDVQAMRVAFRRAALEARPTLRHLEASDDVEELELESEPAVATSASLAAMATSAPESPRSAALPTPLASVTPLVPEAESSSAVLAAMAKPRRTASLYVLAAAAVVAGIVAFQAAKEDPPAPSSSSDLAPPTAEELPSSPPEAFADAGSAEPLP